MEYEPFFSSSSTSMCTYMTVPLDHSKPEGEKIRLFVAKLPATGPGKKLGTLFFNPGGPGVPGSSMARESVRLLFSPEVSGRMIPHPDIPLFLRCAFVLIVSTSPYISFFSPLAFVRGIPLISSASCALFLKTFP